MVNGSFFWKQLIKLHSLFQWCAQWNIGIGKRISYWYDNWGSSPIRLIRDRQPRPCAQLISLQEAITKRPSALNSYTGTILVLSDTDDVLVWRWSASGEYTASSVYKRMITTGKVCWNFMEIWTAAAPSKVKVFTHLMLKNRILTRDTLQRQGINCETNCVLCEILTLETHNHLFFQCLNAQAVWGRFTNLMRC